MPHSYQTDSRVSHPAMSSQAQQFAADLEALRSRLQSARASLSIVGRALSEEEQAFISACYTAEDYVARATDAMKQVSPSASPLAPVAAGQQQITGVVTGDNSLRTTDGVNHQCFAKPHSMEVAEATVKLDLSAHLDKMVTVQGKLCGSDVYGATLVSVGQHHHRHRGETVVNGHVVSDFEIDVDGKRYKCYSRPSRMEEAVGVVHLHLPTIGTKVAISGRIHGDVIYGAQLKPPSPTRK